MLYDGNKVMEFMMAQEDVPAHSGHVITGKVLLTSSEGNSIFSFWSPTPLKAKAGDSSLRSLSI